MHVIPTLHGARYSPQQPKRPAFAGWVPCSLGAEVGLQLAPTFPGISWMSDSLPTMLSWTLEFVGFDFRQTWETLAYLVCRGRKLACPGGDGSYWDSPTASHRSQGDMAWVSDLRRVERASPAARVRVLGFYGSVIGHCSISSVSVVPRWSFWLFLVWSKIPRNHVHCLSLGCELCLQIGQSGSECLNPLCAESTECRTEIFFFLNCIYTMHVQVSKINPLELFPKQCSAGAVSTALHCISSRTHPERVYEREPVGKVGVAWWWRTLLACGRPCLPSSAPERQNKNHLPKSEDCLGCLGLLFLWRPSTSFPKTLREDCENWVFQTPSYCITSPGTGWALGGRAFQGCRRTVGKTNTVKI